MTLNPELLKMLACPQCKGSVEINAEENALTCAACKLAYAIEDDIPVMLVDEARPLDG